MSGATVALVLLVSLPAWVLGSLIGMGINRALCRSGRHWWRQDLRHPDWPEAQACIRGCGARRTTDTSLYGFGADA